MTTKPKTYEGRMARLSRFDDPDTLQALRDFVGGILRGSFSPEARMVVTKYVAHDLRGEGLSAKRVFRMAESLVNTAADAAIKGDKRILGQCGLDA